MPDPSILNVDDYVPGRYARTKLLRQVGLPVIEAGSGQEALELVAKHRPALVMLDVNLPDMSGIEVCKRIRENPETARTTVLHISASNVGPQQQVFGLDSGADGYLVEPVEPAVLIATVNAFLRARRAEEALLKSTEELRWFSYRVAHDLREPLRTITAYSELLRDARPRPEEEKETFLELISQAGQRMGSFIDGLLEYSQASAGERRMETIDCDQLVARVVANLDAAIHESRARIVCEPLPSLCGDPRLEYVFQNLIGNAIKYRREQAVPEIHISARQTGADWVFAVRDNGIGIEREYLEGVFEIFRRLHGQEVPGNGIGLALSRKIVESQGGKIWIESQPGAGSTFFFNLPQKATATARR